MEGIRNIRDAKEALEKGYIGDLLKYLKTGNSKIFENNFMGAYTIVHQLADQGDNHNKDLYDYHNITIQKYIEECYQLSKESPDQFVDKFIQQTLNIYFFIYWMNRVFIYLESFYIKTKRIPTLSQKSFSLYKELFFNPFEESIYVEVNKLIKEYRNGNLELRPKIDLILKIICDMDLSKPIISRKNNKIFWQEGETFDKNEVIYQKKWFEQFFLPEKIKYVKERANTDFQNMSAQDYIISQLKYCDEDAIFLKGLIDGVYFIQKLNEINHKYLFEEKTEEIAKKYTGISIPEMFTNKKYDDLKKIFNAFQSTNGSLEIIGNYFELYIKKKGEEIFENKTEIIEDPIKFIHELIKFKNEMEDFVKNCFENHIIFKNKQYKVLISFMNKEKYAKQLSIYADYCMRSGFKGKSEEEKENNLNEIIDLFKCLNSKLVFQIEANKKMSARLIKGTSLSINTEKLFISKLKQEAGVNYVRKMMDMMNDLEINKKEIESYKISRSKGTPNGIKFNVKVISQNAWEIRKKDMEKFELPKFLSICTQDFETFYIKKYNNKKLMWCLGLSTIEVQFLELKDKNICLCTLPQLLILLYLEKYQTLTLKRISELIGCNINIVLTDIQGLVFNPSYNPKSQPEKGVILGTFDSNTKEFKENDNIYLNKNFIVERQKFQTLPLNVKKTVSGIKEIEEEAAITKKYQDNILQATLTRIMKSRIGQETTHAWLISEASKQIDLFIAQPQQIKENIEKLIEKGIIKRAEKDKACYEYIA